MSFHLLFFFPFVYQFVSAISISSDAILDRQCWHEYPLSTVQIYSLWNGELEYVTATSTSDGSSQYAPWSYPPICTESLESIREPLCVYTSTSFSNGRGISIFTTPKLAEKIASLPAFTAPETSSTSQAPINVHPGTWQTAAIPGKGIGVIASKPLVFKDPVTMHTPAFMAYLESELGMLDREMWWQMAIAQLPKKIREEFLDLAVLFGNERVKVQDITKANTFEIEIEGMNHLAVFPETSRLNHACNPNAQYVIDADFLTHTVQVTRPIAEGEEITVSYTSPLDDTQTRQDHLEEGFLFICDCPRCATGDLSDIVLSEIKSLQNQLNDWSPSSKGSPALADRLMQLHHDEGLEGFMDVAYGFAALAYNADGDSEKAAHFAEMAKEAILMKDGTWSPNLQLWKEVLANPEKHWSYMYRKRG